MTNALEETVEDVLGQLAERDATFCACQQCHDDVVLRTLNKARPRYISGNPIGSAVTRVALAQEQSKAEIAVLVLEAMRLVRAHPRHGTNALRSGGGAP
ncbi:MAG: hypothetical protein MNPFHGCM_01599 [Gemmatimonadaceae bacterium]|nr:hypothetical protein [Gemmatimonadaceae bacterium]